MKALVGLIGLAVSHEISQVIDDVAHPHHLLDREAQGVLDTSRALVRGLASIRRTVSR